MPRKPKPLEELSPAYRRRIERGLERGFSRSQARGHPARGEKPIAEIADLRRLRVVSGKPKRFARYVRRTGERTDWFEREFDGSQVDAAYRYITRNLTRHDILTVIEGRQKFGTGESRSTSPAVVRDQWENQARESFSCAENKTFASLHQMTDRGGFRYYFPSAKEFKNAVDYLWCSVERFYVRFRKK